MGNTIKKVSTYVTEDGKTFETRSEAEQHVKDMSILLDISELLKGHEYYHGFSDDVLHFIESELPELRNIFNKDIA